MRRIEYLLDDGLSIERVQKNFNVNVLCRNRSTDVSIIDMMGPLGTTLTSKLDGD
jgi:hypothetical protein